MFDGNRHSPKSLWIVEAFDLINSCRQYFVVVFKDKPFELWDLRSGTMLRQMPKNFPHVTALVSDAYDLLWRPGFAYIKKAIQICIFERDSKQITSFMFVTICFKCIIIPLVKNTLNHLTLDRRVVLDILRSVLWQWPCTVFILLQFTAPLRVQLPRQDRGHLFPPLCTHITVKIYLTSYFVRGQ